MTYSCYLIENDKSTYVGITNDKLKRLRQHNCEISGGAKYTTFKGPGWNYVCTINNLDKISAMQLEWAIKHEPPMNASGIVNRVRKIVSVLNKEKFTSKSKPLDELDLDIEWYGTSIDSNNLTCISMLDKINKPNISIHITSCSISFPLHI